MLARRTRGLSGVEPDVERSHHSIDPIGERRPSAAREQETDGGDPRGPVPDQRPGVAAKAEIAAVTLNRDLIAELGGPAPTHVDVHRAADSGDLALRQLSRPSRLAHLHPDCGLYRSVARPEVGGVAAAQVDLLDADPVRP